MNDLTLKAMLSGLSPELVETVDRAQREGTILNHHDISPVIDADGDPLIKNQVYRRPNGGLFRVTEWRFGSGNCMNTYYWVWGINDVLKNDRITVDATHTKEGRYYNSKLTKNFSLESLPEDIRAVVLSRR